MKIVKYIFKIFLFIFVGLFLAALIVPRVFKDDIISYVRNDINENLQATLDFKDIDISLIKSFPDLRIEISDLSIIGQDPFEGITLYRADVTKVDVSLLSLIRKEKTPTINSLILERPIINVFIINDTLTNYMIFDTEDTSESAPFQLALNKYEIKNGIVYYQDNTLSLKMQLDNLNHTGRGDFTQDIFDLKTKSTAEKMTVTYDGMTYLKNVNTIFNADIHMDFPNSKYTLKDNYLKLNALEVTGDGFVQLNGDDILMDAHLKSKSQDFKSIVSLIPQVYTKDFDSLKSSGMASVDAIIKGIYNGNSGSLPGFDVKIKIDNGYLKYPALPDDIKNVFADIRIKASRPDYKDMYINIPQFNMLLGKESISGKLLAENLTGNQSLDGYLKANINLNNLRSVIPMDGIEKLTGIINSDLTFKAKMNDIDNENYDAIQFSGQAKGQNIIYQSKGQPSININNVYAEASPSKLTVIGDNMIFGKSDLSLKSLIKNPLAFVSSQKDMDIDIQGFSKFFDLNEWQSNNAPSTQANAVPMVFDAQTISVLDASKIKINWKSDKILWDNYEINNLILLGRATKNAIQIDDFSTSILGNDMAINGIVNNAFDYLLNAGQLNGNINLKSKNMNLNKFMNEVPEDANANTPLQIIPVPENLNLVIASQIDKLTYTNVNMSNFNGTLRIKDQSITIEDMVTQTLGGQIKMQGLYSTASSGAPDFSIKLDLSQMKFLDAFNTFDVFKAAAPISQFIQGTFNTTFVMDGQLGNEMMPILSSLDASGFLETIHGTIKGFDPLQKMSNLLGVKELNSFDLSSTRNWFEINNGTLEVKPFDKNIKGIDMTVSGFHGLNRDMNYTLNLVIPRELLKSGNVGKLANTGVSFLESEAKKLGININQGTHFFVDVLLGGTLKNPTVKIVPKSSKGDNAKNIIQSQIDEAQETIRDTVTKEIDKRKAQVKDTITTRANQEIERIKKEANKQIDKAVDTVKSTVRREVLTRADSISRGIISDTMRRRAEDVLDGKAKEEVDKIKDKLKDFNPFKKKGNKR